MIDLPRIVQDGNRSLVLEGAVRLGGHGIMTKDLDLGPAFRSGLVPVSYSAQAVGTVEEGEVDVDEMRVWIQTQLDKRSKYIELIRRRLGANALAFAAAPAPGGIRAAKGILEAYPLAEVGLVERGRYDVGLDDARANLKAVGLTLPPYAEAEIIRAELAAVREDFGRHQMAGHRWEAAGRGDH